MSKEKKATMSTPARAHQLVQKCKYYAESSRVSSGILGDRFGQRKFANDKIAKKRLPEWDAYLKAVKKTDKIQKKLHNALLDLYETARLFHLTYNDTSGRSQPFETKEEMVKIEKAIRVKPDGEEYIDYEELEE